MKKREYIKLQAISVVFMIIATISFGFAYYYNNAPSNGQMLGYLGEFIISAFIFVCSSIVAIILLITRAILIKLKLRNNLLNETSVKEENH